MPAGPRGGGPVKTAAFASSLSWIVWAVFPSSAAGSPLKSMIALVFMGFRLVVAALTPSQVSPESQAGPGSPGFAQVSGSAIGLVVFSVCLHFAFYDRFGFLRNSLPWNDKAIAHPPRPFQRPVKRID